ncbi:LAMI_0C06392g1_1 [Lachancea mirantina]|uniref:LAMI_0C06392g1_1 n=1 Tax=Lachancea mirantina TaxID=1230905 RepID=A0A1G4J3N9_9SACH|nr:LAMI_0C06392g1_1 [Lachancea mirantina]
MEPASVEAAAAAAVVPDSESDSAETLRLDIYDLIRDADAGSETEHEELAAAKAAAAAAPVGAGAEALATRRLKSSLKLSSSGSSASLPSTTGKSVRFAPQLTTVKRFDVGLEPISISTENSPRMAPRTAPRISPLVALDAYLSDCVDSSDSCDDADGDDEFWFGTALSRSKLPLSTVAWAPVGGSAATGVPGSSGAPGASAASAASAEAAQVPGSAQPAFTVASWALESTNIAPLVARRALDLQSHILAYLQGNNIKLSSISTCLDSNKLQGLIYVANLNFEKFIEVKCTFNSWRDVHYVTAHYHRTVTDAIDEFRFQIDLAGLDFFMQRRGLLYCSDKHSETVCHLQLELCCRYDVNGDTFYDNNNYQNYQVALTATTRPAMSRPANGLGPDHFQAFDHRLEAALPLRGSPATAKPFTPDFLVTTTLTHEPHNGSRAAGRRFSKNTDYYNTSPLKHLFHSDTTLSRAFRINDVTLEPTADERLATETPSTVVPLSSPRSAPDLSQMSTATSPMHFLLNSPDANYTHRSPTPPPLLKSASTSDLDSASPLLDVSSPSTGLTVSSQEMPRIMNSAAASTTNAHHLTYNNSNKHLSKRGLPKKSMDYDTLLQSYCFYSPPKGGIDHHQDSDSNQNFATFETGQGSPWTSRYSSASPPVLLQGQ